MSIRCPNSCMESGSLLIEPPSADTNVSALGCAVKIAKARVEVLNQSRFETADRLGALARSLDTDEVIYQEPAERNGSHSFHHRQPGTAGNLLCPCSSTVRAADS